jgi:hypothetical protein
MDFSFLDNEPYQALETGSDVKSQSIILWADQQNIVIIKSFLIILFEGGL